MRPDRISEDYSRIISTQKDAATAVVNLAVKVDENRFRQLNGNKLDRILQLIEKERKALPPVVEAPFNVIDVE